MDPDHFLTQFVLSHVLARQGHFQEAIALAERALQVLGRFPMSLVVFGGVLVLTGRRDAARDILAELEAMAAKTYSSAGCVAILNCMLGNLDEAVQWAERAIVERDPQVLGMKTSSVYENLRDDPRYRALLAKMNLAYVKIDLTLLCYAEYCLFFWPWPARASLKNMMARGLPSLTFRI